MKWTLINPAGTNDPDTGDIYSGLDRFGRVKDNRWLDGAGADLDRIQYGYDRAGNRIWRRNVVAAALGKEFDELYGYDAIHRLKHMARGTLNGGRTALTSETFAQCWTLDSTGNWEGFREDDDGSGTWDLIQQRSALNLRPHAATPLSRQQRALFGRFEVTWPKRGRPKRCRNRKGSRAC